MNELESICEQLMVLAERLADSSITIIARALDTPEDHERAELARIEKKIAKARRAVDKAIHELQ